MANPLRPDHSGNAAWIPAHEVPCRIAFVPDALNAARMGAGKKFCVRARKFRRPATTRRISICIRALEM